MTSVEARVTRDEVEVARPGCGGAGPHVAVLVSLNFPDLSLTTAELVRRFTRTALQTLVELGASYRLIDTSDPDEVTTDIDADALLLLGGGDISAALSNRGDDAEVPNSYGVDLRADLAGIQVIRDLAAAGKPVLGICRGSQLINVAWNGTLLPDIADFVLHRGGPGEPMFLDEHVNLVPGTRLASLMSATDLVVRSGHHQAVERVAAGFHVAAVADDGIIEAIEHESRWIVGVQWHPEDDDGPADDRIRLFRGFLEAAEAPLD